MKVLLVQPPFNSHMIGAGVFYLHEPLALETLAGCIPHHEVRILDMRLDSNLEKELDDFQPEIVGVTAYTPDVYIATDILKKVKDYNQNILTVIGGHHATMMPQDFKKEFIDVIVIGEGQDTFPELVDVHENKGDLMKIDGLALHQDGKLILTRPRELTLDLDRTSLPRRDLTKRYRSRYFRGIWRPVASMISSRGCPYRCNFCSAWRHEHGKYRARTSGRVVREIENIEEEHISISDDNFLQDLKRAESIYEIIKERGIKKKYKLIGRTDSVIKRPDLIEKWKEIGMEMITLGIESFRDEELKSLNKSNTVRNNEEAIHILHDNDIMITAQFIINPEYTEEDFEALEKYVKKMNLLNPVFTVLTPLPGTVLYEEKSDQLLTQNYEMFDLVHSVLPTKLPRKDFYRCYANLTRRCYSFENIKDKERPISLKKIADYLYLQILNAYKL